MARFASRFSAFLPLFMVAAILTLFIVPFSPEVAGFAPLLGMAAVSVTSRVTDYTRGRKRKTFVLTSVNNGDTLDTRLRKINSVQIIQAQEPFSVSDTLVAGTVTITDARILATSRAVVSRVSNAGTDGHLEAAVGAGEIVITSSSGADTSVVDVVIHPIHVTGYSVSAGTITFVTDPDGAAACTVVAEGF